MIVEAIIGGGTGHGLVYGLSAKKGLLRLVTFSDCLSS